jgi:hypothetical protein
MNRAQTYEGLLPTSRFSVGLASFLSLHPRLFRFCPSRAERVEGKEGWGGIGSMGAKAIIAD